MLTIGDRIKYFRKRRGLTQAQLAECTGIHPVSIRKYETNKMQPQLSQIEKIADALCLSTSALTGSYSEIIKLETVGNLMGLLIMWHKSGILTLQGERGEDNKLIASTVHLVPNPALQNCLSVTLQGENKEAIPTDDLMIKLRFNSLLDDLIRWEDTYNGFNVLAAQHRDSTDEYVLTTMNEIYAHLTIIEMELQATTRPLQWMCSSQQ